MTEPEGGPQAAVCSTCREPMRPGASKCKTCGSYQDWRRHLSMGSSVLALLVALVSVLSFAGPIMAELIAKDHSNVSVTLQTIYGNKAIFNASNSGNKAGAVGSAYLRMNAQGARTSLPLPPVAEPPIVAAGESRQVVFELTPPIRQAIQSFAPNADGEAEFTVEVTQFGGSQTFSKSELGLGRLRAEVKYGDPRCRGFETVDQSKLTQREQMFAQGECGIYPR